MNFNISLKKLISLKKHFQKLDNRGGLLIPISLKLKDYEFMKYLHLPVNWEIKPITSKDLPEEFSPKAVKLVDLFRRKTIDLNYEVMLIFDYMTADLIYCFVNDNGEFNEISGDVNEDIFQSKHIATIHNHPLNYVSALSAENFQILELEFEEYELVSSYDALWILKSKELLSKEEVNEIKDNIRDLYKYSKIQSEYDFETIYNRLLIEYINNTKFNIELTRRLLR